MLTDATKTQLDNLKEWLETGIIDETEAKELKLSALRLEHKRKLLKEKEIALTTTANQHHGLVSILKQQGKENNNPWRAEYRRTMEAIEIIRESMQPSRRDETFAQLKRKYTDRVKANALSSMEICIGKELFSNEESEIKCLRLAKLLFGIRKEERLSFYNWEIFDTFSEVEEVSLGERVAHLNKPLLPPEEFSEANETMLMRASIKDTMHGGGHANADGFEIYLRSLTNGAEITQGGVVNFADNRPPNYANHYNNNNYNNYNNNYSRYNTRGRRNY